jgi:hypothetical protein
VIFCGHFYPIFPKVLFIKCEYAQWIVLIDIIILKLIQDDEDEQLQENFLPKKDKRDPKDVIKLTGATIKARQTVDIPRCGRIEHVEIPILPGEIYEHKLKSVMEILVIVDFIHSS